MNLHITVQVDQHSEIAAGVIKNLYRNSVLVDDAVSFDYVGVYKALRLLYPKRGVIISFSIKS